MFSHWGTCKLSLFLLLLFCNEGWATLTLGSTMENSAVVVVAVSFQAVSSIPVWQRESRTSTARLPDLVGNIF